MERAESSLWDRPRRTGKLPGLDDGRGGSRRPGIYQLHPNFRESAVNEPNGRQLPMSRSPPGVSRRACITGPNRPSPHSLLVPVNKKSTGGVDCRMGAIARRVSTAVTGKSAHAINSTRCGPLVGSHLTFGRPLCLPAAKFANSSLAMR